VTGKTAGADDFRLDGRTVLVTGATSGIGRTTAIRAHARGASVVATGRREDALRDLASELGAERATTIAADLTNDDDVKQLLSAVPMLDGAVFAAGFLKIKLAKATSVDDVRQHMATNFEGSALLASRLLHAKRLQGGASLVFISSVAASIGAVGHAAYAASKGALESYVRALAVEIGSSKSRANLVAPAEVKTPMLDQARKGLGQPATETPYLLGLGEPDDVAAACCFLLSPAARWITGTTLTVDGGYSASRKS
jgi:NAD(P)-dependent dehydrogenase (short-subunit alcohol dehydrogenase family)